MHTDPFTKALPLTGGGESITQRRDWIKTNIIKPITRQFNPRKVKRPLIPRHRAPGNHWGRRSNRETRSLAALVGFVLRAGLIYSSPRGQFAVLPGGIDLAGKSSEREKPQIRRSARIPRLVRSFARRP